MDEHAWREKSVEILTDVKEWRRAHPKATYVEIEDEVFASLCRTRRWITLKSVIKCSQCC